MSEARNLATALEVEPLTPAIGAEIHGIDLAADLSEPVIAGIRAALLKHKVIFFRDQHALTRERHLAFARRFGELEVHPGTPDDQDNPEIFILAFGPEKRAHTNYWHSDVTWRECPSMGSILRAVALPENGGDTLWVNMVAAYAALPDELKQRLDGLTATHSFDRVFGHRYEPAERTRLAELYPDQHHPVVRTHPETGEKVLYVNSLFTQALDGMAPDESRELLGLLYLQSMVPEYQLRFRWTPNAVAFWDNRSTQHYACSDYFPHVRVMERATIIGDRPY